MRRLASWILIVVLAGWYPAAAVSFKFPSILDIFSLFHHKHKQQGAEKPQRGNHSVDVTGLKPVFTKQRCENWTWAANTEAALAQQSVVLPQAEIVTRTEGGELCKDDGPDFDTMARNVQGDYPLPEGGSAHVDVLNVTGAPTAVDDLIVAIRQNRPLLMFWRGHGYLLTGLSYDESIAADNGRMFEITELRLLDPMAKPGSQAVTFQRDQDDPKQIEGIMDVKVTLAATQSWAHPEDEYQRNHRSAAERQPATIPPLAPEPQQSWSRQPAPEPSGNATAPQK